MADTNWPDFPDTSYVEETDILLALRGAGGVNIPGSAFVKKRSDGHVAIQRAGGGAQELILSLDAGSTGFGVRDTQIRAGNNGSNQTYLDFYTSNAASPARAMRIDSNGNVGIGTTTPGSKLDVAGKVRLSGGEDNQLEWVNNGQTWRLNNSTGGKFYLYDVTGTKFPFGVLAGAPNDSLLINGSGNVGIGTGSPADKLHVVGGNARIETSAFPKVIFNGSGNTANAKKWQLYVDNLGIFKIASLNDAESAEQRTFSFSTTALTGGVDNTISIGTASVRCTVFYAVTGSINTSDERTKQDITPIPDEWLDAWGALEWVRYKFKDAVAAKGDDARWHVGLVAQAVRDAFAARDLDAQAIGLLCYDQWEEQLEPIMEERQIDTEEVVVDRINTGLFDAHGEPVFRDVTEDRPIMGMVDTGETRVTLEAGDRWGLRYDECQAMEAAWQRRELARNSAISEERIAGLEAMNKLLSDRLAALEAAA